MAWKRRTDEEKRAAGLPVPDGHEEPEASAAPSVQEFEDGVAVGSVPAPETFETEAPDESMPINDMAVSGDTQDLSAEPAFIPVVDDDDDFVEDGPMFEGEIEYEAQIDIHGESDLPDKSSYKKAKKWRKRSVNPEDIEETRRSAKTFKLIMTLCVIVIVLAIALVGFRLGYAIFNGDAEDDPADARTYVVYVEEGDSVNSIISELSQNGIIGSGFIAKIQNKIFDYGLAVGTYTVDSSMTSLEILDYISEAEHSEGLPSDTRSQETMPETVPSETESQTAEDSED